MSDEARRRLNSAIEIIEQLIKAGADPNVRDQHGLNALTAASGRPRELSDLIRRHGAVKQYICAILERSVRHCTLDAVLPFQM